MEVGCGTGATILPLLRRYSLLRGIAFDFSHVATSLLRHIIRCGEVWTPSPCHPVLEWIPKHVRLDNEDSYSIPEENTHTNPCSSRCVGPRLTVFQHDITSSPLPSFLVPVRSVDVSTLAFTLSSIAPEYMLPVLRHIHLVLSLGGLLLFRDYAACDLVHSRFLAKGHRKLAPYFYVRGGSFQFGLNLSWCFNFPLLTTISMPKKTTIPTNGT